MLSVQYTITDHRCRLILVYSRLQDASIRDGGTGEPGETYGMNMKYFRFLYGETSGCMIHFGEVNDTKMNETFTFLVIRGNDMQDEQKNGKQSSSLLFPDSVDLVIFENVNEAVTMAWNEMQPMKVSTVIVPDIPDAEHLHSEMANEVIRLRPVLRNDLKLAELPEDSLWKTIAAGWQMQVLCWSEGSLAVWHDAADDSLTGICTEKKEIGEFIDCVMSVKTTENSRCSRERNPDHYGCALGCALHRDYDVCKFRYENRANPYLTGTLLTAGKTEEKAEETENHHNTYLLEWLSEKSDRVRFLAAQDLGEYSSNLIGDENREPGMRRYFIGLSDEVSDQMAAGLCKKGFGSAPILLKEGSGVCCSGFLKYKCNEEYIL